MKERKRNRLRGFDYSSDNLYFITSCVHDRVCCFGEIRRTNDDGTNNDGGDVGTGRDLSPSQCNDDVRTNNFDANDVRTGRDLSLRHHRNHSNNDHFPRDPHSSHPRQKMILNEYGIIAEQQWDWLENQYSYIVLHAFVVMPNHIHGIIEIKRTNDVGTIADGVVGTGRDLSPGQCNDDVGTGRDLSLRERQTPSSPPKNKSLSELMGAYKTTISKKIHLLGYNGFTWQRSFYEHIIRDERSFETISDYIMNNPSKWEQDKFFNK